MFLRVLKLPILGNTYYMIKAVHNIVNVKKSVNSIIGEAVTVKVNLGRNKFVNFKGKLTAVYPSLFTVSPTDDYKGKTSA